MKDPLLTASRILAATPQNQPIPGHKDMVKNNAGGYGFKVDDWVQFNQFLILGTIGGTYYVSEKDLTDENVDILHRLISEDYARYLSVIIEIDSTNRAAKRAPVLFALALCAAAPDVEARRLALEIMPKIVRTGSDLMRFVNYLDGMRGWGRALRRGIGSWYDQHPNLALQVIKYRGRYGYTHRDLLRLAHPQSEVDAQKALYDWICRGNASDALPELVKKFIALQEIEDAVDAAAFLRQNRMPHEAVRTELQGDPAILQALAWTMPVGALLRNLGRLTSKEVLAENKPELLAEVCRTLVEGVLGARVHPVSILSALNVYKSGRGVRGSLVWKPLPAIIDALDDAFYNAFAGLVPTDKKIMIGLDVSGSMSRRVLGLEGLSAREAAAAMMMTFLRTEHHRPIIRAFAHQLVPLDISKKMRLDDVISKTSRLPFGGTDCSLPMKAAIEEGLDVDLFVVITDNETWAGRNSHPSQALAEYRKKVNPNARLVVLATSGSYHSIVDPKDSGMLQIEGFDSAAPELVAAFARGEI